MHRQKLCLPHWIVAKGRSSISWSWNTSSCFGIIVFLMGSQRKKCISANYSIVQIEHYYVLWNNLHNGNKVTLCLVISISSIGVFLSTIFFFNGKPQVWCGFMARNTIILFSIMYIKIENKLYICTYVCLCMFMKYMLAFEI